MKYFIQKDAIAIKKWFSLGQCHSHVLIYFFLFLPTLPVNVSLSIVNGKKNTKSPTYFHVQSVASFIFSISNQSAMALARYNYCVLFPLYRHGRNFDFSCTLNILCYELCRQGTEVTVHFWYIQIIALNLTKSSKAFNSSSIKSAYSESIRITRVNSLHWFCQVYGDNFNIYEKWKFIPNFCCPTLVQLTVIAKIWFLFLVCAFVRALDVQDIG